MYDSNNNINYLLLGYFYNFYYKTDFLANTDSQQLILTVIF